MESNKLIAEFMGAEWHKDFFKDVCIISPSNISYKFDTSWDWLMPVVEKIEALKHRVEISHNGCLIESHKDLDNARMNSGIGEIEPTKLKATYKAVVKFIKNQNKQ